jgi:hypothetical protein
MPVTPDVPVESSPTTDAAPEYLSPEQMNQEQRTQWLLKGEVPLAGVTTEKSPTSDEGTDAAATEGETPLASSEAPPPAPQPGKKQEQAKPRKPQSANDRIRELLAENERLRAAAAPPPAPKPAEKPAAAPAKPAVAPQSAATEDPEPMVERKPDGTRWKDWNEFKAAHAQWVNRQLDQRVHAALEQREAQKAGQQVIDTWNQRCSETAKDPNYADFRQVAFKPDGISINQTTKAFLFTSPEGPKILYQLQKNPAIAQQLAQSDPLTTARVLVTLENSLTGIPAAGKTAAPGGQQPAARTAPKTKPTMTPNPPEDLGARNSAPADEQEAAIRNDDFRAFYNAEVRKAVGNPR